ncbi:MAG: transcriptional regulator, effector-binding domain/component [Paucimonas sp.]|nr:transcriptional regulator, effector-binding domain/component [Paucimonas sp.]
MLDQPHITHSAAQATAVIRLTIPRDQIRLTMQPAISELMSTLAAQGIAPAGPRFSHHLRMDPDGFDFEVGVPVATPVSAAGRVQPGQLPATRVARTVYSGPYEKLGEAWGEFIAWIKSEGYVMGEDLWESYVSGPEDGADPMGWRTELNRPLRG